MRKFVRLVVTLLTGSVAPKAYSQASFYGDLSASKLTYLFNTNAYGPAIRTFINVKILGPVKFFGDLRGTFVDADGMRSDGVLSDHVSQRVRNF